jgi:hypothetical protein
MNTTGLQAVLALFLAACSGGGGRAAEDGGAEDVVAADHQDGAADAAGEGDEDGGSEAPDAEGTGDAVDDGDGTDAAWGPPSFFCVSQPAFNHVVQEAIGGEDYWAWFMRHMEAVGAQITRFTGPILVWAAVEPTLGGGYVFAESDRAIDSMAAGSRPPDLVFTINPTTGITDGRDPVGANAGEYRAFVRAVFDRYAPGGAAPYNADLPVRYFQVGNEIQDVPPVDDYVVLLELSATALRESGTAAELITVGGFTDSREFYPAVIRGVAERRMGDVVAGVDVHSWAEEGLAPFVDAVRALRADLDANGLEHVRIWTIENGTYYGCPEVRPGDPPAPPRTEREQAMYMIKAMMFGRAEGLDVYCWNNLVDWFAFAGDPEGIFSAMGLIGDGTGNACEDPARVAVPRIVYHAFQRLAANLDAPGIVFEDGGGTPVGARLAHRVSFRDGATGGRIHVLFWDDGGSGDMTIEVSTTTAHVVPLITDLDGRAPEYDVDSAGGSAVVDVDGAALVRE